MKRSLSFTLEILAKLGACLAAFIGGCSPKNPPDPEKPHTIHWRSDDSNYADTTTVRPTDKASSTGNK